jgi:hypothetical protein
MPARLKDATLPEEASTPSVLHRPRRSASADFARLHSRLNLDKTTLLTQMGAMRIVPLILVSGAALLAGAPAFAQLQTERIENGKRICVYPPAGDPNDAVQRRDRRQDEAERASRFVRLDIWQRCPNQFPRTGSFDQVPPPFATLIGQVRREGRLYCQYRQGDRTYEVARGNSSICNFTPAGW